jgi:hypothetical protein
MAGVWDSILTLELIVPSNGSLTPGSATIYIGGPQLPVELVGYGVTGAIVWYSDQANVNVYDYTFIALVPGSGWVRGSCSGGNLTLAERWVINGLPPYTPAQLSAFGYESHGTDTSFDWILNGVGYVEYIEMNGLGVVPYIKAGVSSSIDLWKGPYASVQTIAGVAGTTVQYDVRRTVDGLVEIRFAIVFPVAPATCNFLTGALANLTSTYQPDQSPWTFWPFGAAWSNDGVAQNCQIINDAILINGTFANPGGATIFQGSVTYTKGK